MPTATPAPMAFLSTSPLRGTTVGRNADSGGNRNFYPRPPCGGRRGKPQKGGAEMPISIHVPLAGDDGSYVYFTQKERYFYPRPPCGGRLGGLGLVRPKFISIHVPLAGDDIAAVRIDCEATLFLSTSPLRGTTANVTENTVYFPAHLSQQDTAYKNTLRFCAVCGRFRGASARSALKMLCSPVRTARRFSAR